MEVLYVHYSDIDLWKEAIKQAEKVTKVRNTSLQWVDNDGQLELHIDDTQAFFLIQIGIELGRIIDAKTK